MMILKMKWSLLVLMIKSQKRVTQIELKMGCSK